MPSGYEKSPDYGGRPAGWRSWLVSIIFLIIATTTIGLLAYRLIVSTATPEVGEFQGSAGAIIDGDTFDLCSGGSCQRVRLCGIDAPERGQPGFEPASNSLKAILDNQIVRCIQVGRGTVCDGRSKPTNRRRIVAQCFVDNLDVAAEMVNAGHACDWPEFSGGAYTTSVGVCVRR